MRQQLPGVPILFLATALMRTAGNNHTDNLRTNALIREMNARSACVAGDLGIEMVDIQPLLDSGRADMLYTDQIHAHAERSAYYAAVRDLVVLRLGLLAERAENQGQGTGPGPRLPQSTPDAATVEPSGGSELA